VTIAGALTANSGERCTAQPGAAPIYGERGHLADATQAAGAGQPGKAGGSGGAAGKPPTGGQTDLGGGGGGGAAGALAIKSLMSSLTGATFSPSVASSQATLE
jgi:hypothetical protein